MIVPMKKVTLIALQNERESALASLRDLGVMQIELEERFSSESSAVADRVSFLKRMYDLLEQYAVENKMLPAKKSAVPAMDAANETYANAEKRAAVESKLVELSRRLENLAVWGDFDRSLLEKLKNSGVNVFLCTAGNVEFEQLRRRDDIQCHVISRSKGKIAFAVIAMEDIDESGLPVVRLDENDDPRRLKEKITALKKEQDSLIERLHFLADNRGCIADALVGECAALEFCRVRDSLAEHGAVAALTGFVPTPEIGKISEAAKINGWGLLITDPADDEDVPVLLKDNKFTRIIKPLFDFLGIVPGYREIDISGAVLIFFTIFYAIIIGDAGYGIIFGAASVCGLLAGKKIPKLVPPMRLLLVLSVAATIWGALCGSWFGMSVIPFTDKPFPALACFRDFASSAAKQANIQFFCFVLAVIQLSVGRIWRVVRERNWRAAGQHFGWMLIIWGNFFLTVRLIVYPGEFPGYMYILYGTGLLLVMVCGVNWKQASDVFQFPFDIIGSFTDVLSYIRLFAVGLAGACIAGSFNGMAFDLAQVSVWLLPAGIIVALVGHALNIALALLSVLVHAVRLNTLEFSNHTGLSWSGQSFNPFKLNKKEE
ncbi:MAG: hypothetical protein E7057_00065 [Lentisphaerae bacterium]|nr:hypothetical protein [Lentisphaerota bacterium]